MRRLRRDHVRACRRRGGYVQRLCFLRGYTNGCGRYLATAEEYDRGGFEVLHSYLVYYMYFGRVMPLNRDTADRLVSIVAEWWNKMKAQ